MFYCYQLKIGFLLSSQKHWVPGSVKDAGDTKMSEMSALSSSSTQSSKGDRWSYKQLYSSFILNSNCFLKIISDFLDGPAQWLLLKNHTPWQSYYHAIWRKTWISLLIALQVFRQRAFLAKRRKYKDPEVAPYLVYLSKSKEISVVREAWACTR